MTGTFKRFSPQPRKTAFRVSKSGLKTPKNCSYPSLPAISSIAAIPPFRIDYNIYANQVNIYMSIIYNKLPLTRYKLVQSH